MKSYDRLFQSGYFAQRRIWNLIALPFQREAMLLGNSVFIDDDEAYPISGRSVSIKRRYYREVEAFRTKRQRRGRCSPFAMEIVVDAYGSEERAMGGIII